MKCYIVSYDLKSGSNFDYQRLYDAIKGYETWAHINESLWAVVTDQTAIQVRDNLKQYIDQGDSLFVLKSGVEAAWAKVICHDEWLKKYL